MDNFKLKWFFYFLNLIILYFIYKKNLDNNNTIKEASVDEYSSNNLYKNITPMNHDIFKQMTLDYIPLIILNIALSKNKFNLEENMEHIAKLLIGFISYYQLIQPYVVNKLLSF